MAIDQITTSVLDGTLASDLNSSVSNFIKGENGSTSSVKKRDIFRVNESI